jgi:hypothetical protein
MKTFLLLAVVVLFATVATAWAGAVRSAALRKRFEELGVLPGRTVDEIVRHAGPPHRRVKLEGGREVLVWRRINFHVELHCTAGICDSVAYEG